MSWSPDGKKMFVSDAGDNSEYVLDSNGKILAQLKNLNMLGDRVWSSDSEKIIFSSQDSTVQWSIKSVGVSNGNHVTTLAKLPANYGVTQFSPDGKQAIVQNLDKRDNTSPLQIWDLQTGKKIGELAVAHNRNAFGWAFSPDSSLLAIDDEGVINIYTSADGKLLTSFENKVSGQGVHNIVWSPDGKYLAESATVIKVYDVTAKKLVTTFGQVDAQHRITTLIWSSDGKGLASSTLLLANNVPDVSDNRVSVWSLN
ncbi:MAG TPA: hypothetical protein VGD98_10495 [Ktedonobacteraceae bacterium]